MRRCLNALQTRNISDERLILYSQRQTVKCSQHRKFPPAEVGVSWRLAVASFFRPMSFPHSDSPLPPSNMSGIHVLSGARNVVVSGTVNVAETVREALSSLTLRLLCVSPADQLQLELESQNDIRRSHSVNAKLKPAVHRADRNSRQTQGSLC